MPRNSSVEWASTSSGCGSWPPHSAIMRSWIAAAALPLICW